MSWLILFCAGMLEVIWACGLRYTEGFTRPLPSIITLVAMTGSLYLLSIAVRTLPLSVAYAVWVGVGVVGATVAGVLVFQESITLAKVISLLLLGAGIIGLKLSSLA